MAAIAAAIGLAPGSAAATTVGSDLAGAADSGFGCTMAGQTCTAAVTAPAGAYVSPINGIVVRWRFKSNGSGAGTPLNLRILHPGNTLGTFSGAGTSTAFPMPATPGTFTVDTRLPIQAGDRIGLNAIFNLINVTNGETPAATVGIWNPVLADGGAALASTGSIATWDLLVNADVEPDADHDGFGDQTQDLCPTDPTTHAACPVSPTTKKKCKKGHKLVKHKGKRKCVKKKKKRH